MALDNLSDDALQKIAEGRLDELSDDELAQVAEDGETSTAGQPPPKESKIKGFLRRAGEASENLKNDPAFAMSPTGMALKARDIVGSLADKAGETMAETLAGPGLQADIIPGFPVPLGRAAKAGEKGLKTSPEVAAGIGTAIQMAPDIAETFIGGGALRGAAKAGKLGQAGRVVSGPSRKVAGTAIEATERAAGINTKTIPTLQKIGEELKLPANQRTAKNVINSLNQHIDEGAALSKQELSNTHKLMTDLLSEEPKGLAKVFSTKPSKLGKSGVAQASRLDQTVVKRINEAVPGRAEQAKNYGAAKTRTNIYKGAAGLAALTGAGSKIEQIIRALALK